MCEEWQNLKSLFKQSKTKTKGLVHSSFVHEAAVSVSEEFRNIIGLQKML